jgi:predicted  nucleic acid-binding Zn-ribbon protein
MANASTRKASFDLDQLNEIIAKATAEAVAKAMAEANASKQADIDAAVKAAMAAKETQAKADVRAKALTGLAKAVADRGFKDCVLLDPSKPVAEQISSVSVLTYGKWLLDCGRIVERGQKAIAYKQYRLFHKDQTRIATPQERKDYFAKMQAKAASREAKADQQPSV